jgi:hypothetical protein
MVKKKLTLENTPRKLWSFLKKDSWPSFVISLLLAFVFIKYIFFPTLSFATGTPLPLVIVESCSMYHSAELEDVLQNSIYQDYNIDLEATKDWPLKNGLNKGDIIFTLSPKNIEVGDVVIFNANKRTPIIHRTISINEQGQTITTKGDHNPALLKEEKDISKNSLIGRAVFRVPYLGWVKLIFFEYNRPEKEKGFCT